MMKSIIITGPQGSGKTYIACSMALTHEPGKTSFRQSDDEIIRLHAGMIDSQFFNKYSLIVIDECSVGDIYDFYNAFVKIPMENICTILYLTQDKVSRLPDKYVSLIDLERDIKNH